MNPLSRDKRRLNATAALSANAGVEHSSVTTGTLTLQQHLWLSFSSRTAFLICVNHCLLQTPGP